DVQQSAPASPPADDFDSLLREFDERTAQQPETVPDNSAHTSQAPDIDALLAEFGGPSAEQQRIDELTQQVDGFRTAEHRRAELQAFNQYADDLQKQLPSFLPEGYARLKLESLAYDPLICAAFDMRNVDARAAKAELQKVQVTLAQLQLNPAADPKQ